MVRGGGIHEALAPGGPIPSRDDGEAEAVFDPETKLKRGELRLIGEKGESPAIKANYPCICGGGAPIPPGEFFEEDEDDMPSREYRSAFVRATEVILGTAILAVFLSGCLKLIAWMW